MDLGTRHGPRIEDGTRVLKHELFLVVTSLHQFGLKRKRGKKLLSSVYFVFLVLFELIDWCANMPQLNGGGGDDLGANDEMIPFKDEGEQEEKISENVSAERDLDDVKSSLVNESENNSSSSDSEVNCY